MKKLYVFFAWILILIFSANYSAQCTGCTVTNPTLSGNYTFTSGSTVCFTSNATLGDVTFQNNSKICVAPGVTVIIQNNVTTTSGNNITFEVGGTLQFNQTPTINANLTTNIKSNGILKAGSTGNNNFSFNGLNNTLNNFGTMQVSVLQFQNSGATNIVDNYGTLTIGSNINIQGNTTFRNWQTINIGQSYNNNATSTYINCGTINSSNGFNLGGGKVINTGNFNVPNGQLDLPDGSRIENYGTFSSGGTVNNNGVSSTIYNEGLFTITNYQGNGWLKGPDSSSKKGYFETVNQMLINSSKVGPNLDFKRTSGASTQATVFNSAPTYVTSAGTTTTQSGANVSFDCRTAGNCTAPLITNIGLCPNVNGTFTPQANDDSFTIISGNNSTTSVLANDFAIFNGASATTSNVTITQVSTTNSGVNVNSSGIVTVSSGTPSGNYTVIYRICSISDPTSCDTATVIVSVPLDTDGDGIINSLDLDDDNDGILDCDENGLNRPINQVFELNGNASQISTSEVQLTPAANNQAGQMWSYGKIDFTKNFTISFDAYLGNNDGGADGVAIVFHNDPAGINAIGANGDGIGARGIQNGVVLELDTYTNSFDPGSPSGPDHGQIWRSSDQTAITTPISLPNLENGTWQLVVVNWNASSQTLSYTVNGTVAGTYTGNVVTNFFGGANKVYFGYTASTGGLNNDQRIRFSSLCSLPLEVDTDNDGTPNSLDLDSDGDGCPDAIEGDENVTASQLTANRISGTINNNGVPNLVNSGGAADIGGDQGQGIGTSQNATLNTCLDSDNDGYPDDVDLDDDNDGILDTLECPGTASFTNGGLEGTAAVATEPTGWSRVTYDEPYNEATISGQDTVDIITSSGPASGIGLSGVPAEGNSAIHAVYGPSISGDFAQEGIKQTISGLVVGRYYRVTFKQAVVKSLNYVGNTGKWKVFLDGNFIFASLPTTSTLVYTDPNISWESRTFTFTATSTSHTIAFLASGLSTTDKVAMGLDDIKFDISCDTDNDGTPNSLDLDSDNDGCADALEGDENVTASQLTANRISGTINNNGVPNLVNSGGTADIGGDQGQGAGQAYTVNPAAVGGTASSSQSICTGATPTALTLTGSTGSIQWQSSTDNVTFNNISGATSTTYAPGALTATTYYRAILTSAGGCTATSTLVTITVNPLPTITGTTSVCVGSTTQLTGSGTPAAANPWTSSNTAIATVSNTGLVTGIAAGSVTITYTNNNGCSITTTVTVNPLPTITGTTSVCVGNTTQLTGSGTPAAANPWTSSNTAIATVSNTGLVTGVAVGSVTITYTNNNGCSITTTVTVNNCIDAVNDNFGNVTPGSTTASVILNDFNNGSAAVIGTAAGQVSIRTATDAAGTVGSWPSGLTLNADGTITVAANASAGAYTLYYTICNQTAGSPCDTAAVTLFIPLCYKPAQTTGTALDTNHGITALGRAGDDNSNWPMVRKGAWTVLEAKTKGFVVNRLTDAQVSAIPAADLREGMMVYNITQDCLQINIDGTATGWRCFNTQTCPDF